MTKESYLYDVIILMVAWWLKIFLFFDDSKKKSNKFEDGIDDNSNLGSRRGVKVLGNGDDVI